MIIYNGDVDVFICFRILLQPLLGTVKRKTIGSELFT
jgi:hypothetical protein